jgi:type VI secretion system secreted protein VgrG
MAGMARLLEAGTPLGKDVLVLQRMAGKEELGRLPEFPARFLVAAPRHQAGGDPRQEHHLGARARERLAAYFQRLRHGLRRKRPKRRVGVRDRRQGQRLPCTWPRSSWLWFLTRASNCRIFQNMSVLEIAEEVFDGRIPSPTQEVQLRKDYPKREFSVQYRETDFNFVCRLFEQEGIYSRTSTTTGKNTWC